MAEFEYTIIDDNCNQVAFYYYAEINPKNIQILPEHVMMPDGSAIDLSCPPVCGSCGKPLMMEAMTVRFWQYEINTDSNILKQFKLRDNYFVDYAAVIDKTALMELVKYIGPNFKKQYMQDYEWENLAKKEKLARELKEEKSLTEQQITTKHY